MSYLPYAAQDIPSAPRQPIDVVADPNQVISPWGSAAEGPGRSRVARAVTARAWLLFFGLSALWGASFFFIEIALRELEPPMVALGRTAPGLLVLVPLALHRGVLGGMRPMVGPVLALGAVQIAGPFLLISGGQASIHSGLAGILVATTPIFTALLALRLDLDERSRGSGLLGIALGMVGVALLLGFDTGGGPGALLGGLMLLLAAFGYALGGFVAKSGVREVEPLTLTTGTMICASIFLAPFGLVSLPAAVPSATVLASLAALSFGATAIGWVVYYGLIRQIGPARASLVTYVAPGVSVLLGIALLDEPATVSTFAGLGLILAGSWLAANRRSRPVAVHPGRA